MTRQESRYNDQAMDLDRDFGEVVVEHGGVSLVKEKSEPSSRQP